MPATLPSTEYPTLAALEARAEHILETRILRGDAPDPETSAVVATPTDEEHLLELAATDPTLHTYTGTRENDGLGRACKVFLAVWERLEAHLRSRLPEIEARLTSEGRI